MDKYVANGAAPQDLNLGLAFHTKYFLNGTRKSPGRLPAGVVLPFSLEDPTTGEDQAVLARLSWHDQVPADVADSFAKALVEGNYDDREGAYYYFDPDEDLFWSFDTPAAITRKISRAFGERRIGSVFAWGLGEDAPLFRRHLLALNDALAGSAGHKDEL